jgi:hypothetical protein
MHVFARGVLCSRPYRPDELIARVRNTLALTPDPGWPVAEEVNPRRTEEASAGR